VPLTFLDPSIPTDTLTGLENRLRTITGVPPNMKLDAVDNNTHIQVTLTYRDNQIVGVGLWRVFYLSAKLVTASDLYTPINFHRDEAGNITFTGFFDVIQGKQTWVIDISNSGTTAVATVAAAPFTDGGWFFAIGVDVAGTEYPYFATTPVAIPASIVTGPGIGPLIDVTGPSVVLTHKTKSGEFLDTVACTYTAPPPDTSTPLYGFAGVMPVIFNNFNSGGYEEVQFFQYKGEGPGATTTFSFDILRDDGSNPGPTPPFHTVVIYFLAVDRVGGRISQPINFAPFAVLVGGFN